MDSGTLMDTELRECSICIEATCALVGCMEYKQLYAVVPWIEKNYKKKFVTFFFYNCFWLKPIESWMWELLCKCIINYCLAAAKIRMQGNMGHHPLSFRNPLVH